MSGYVWVVQSPSAAGPSAPNLLTVFANEDDAQAAVTRCEDAGITVWLGQLMVND